MNSTAVSQTVTALVDCLIRHSPGLECPLAQAYTARAGPAWQSRYIGVMRTLTCSDQEPDPNVKSDASRLVWNFLVAATSAGPATLANGGWLG